MYRGRDYQDRWGFKAAQIYADFLNTIDVLFPPPGKVSELLNRKIGQLPVKRWNVADFDQGEMGQEGRELQQQQEQGFGRWGEKRKKRQIILPKQKKLMKQKKASTIRQRAVNRLKQKQVLIPRPNIIRDAARRLDQYGVKRRRAYFGQQQALAVQTFLTKYQAFYDSQYLPFVSKGGRKRVKRGYHDEDNNFQGVQLPSLLHQEQVQRALRASAFTKLRRLLQDQQTIGYQSITPQALPQFYAIAFRLQNLQPKSRQTIREVNRVLKKYNLQNVPDLQQQQQPRVRLARQKPIALVQACGNQFATMIQNWCGRQVIRHWAQMPEEVKNTRQIADILAEVFSALGANPNAQAHFVRRGGRFTVGSRMLDGIPTKIIRGQLSFAFNLNYQMNMMADQMPQTFRRIINTLITVGLMQAWIPVIVHRLIDKYKVTITGESRGQARNINSYLTGKLPLTQGGNQVFSLYINPTSAIQESKTVKNLMWKMPTGRLQAALQKFSVQRALELSLRGMWTVVAQAYWNNLKQDSEHLLQNYAQRQQKAQSVLSIRNFFIAYYTYIPSQYYVFDERNRYWGGASAYALQWVIRSMRGPSRAVQIFQMLEWPLYAPKKRAMISQFQKLQPICLQTLASKLVEIGYPGLSTTPQRALQQIVNYCHHLGLSYSFLGFPQKGFDGGSSFKVIFSPRHVQLVPVKKEMPSGFQPLAFYQRHPKAQILYKDQQVNLRKEVSKWKVGDELPLDPQLDRTQKKLRVRSMVIDIQSLSVTQEIQTPYMICAVGYPYQGDIFYRCWSNVQICNPSGPYRILGNPIQRPICIRLFVQWLASIVHQYQDKAPLTLWGYNSMGYEIAYLVKELTLIFGVVQLLGAPSECKSFSVGEGKIIFADIQKILPVQALSKACKQFNIIIKKQDLNIALYKTWSQIIDHYQQIKHYCFIDCVSTLLLVHKTQCGFIKIAQDLGMSFDIEKLTRKVTAAGLGWSFFIQGFLKRSIFSGVKQNTLESVYNNQPFEVYSYQRMSYTGGVVQVFRYVHQGKVFVVDINSMYPAMLLRPMPWRYQGEFIQGSLQQILAQQNSSMYLFQITFYQLPSTFLGAFIATRQLGPQGKNTYYNSYGGQPMYMRGVTMKRLLYHGGIVRWTRGWRYSSGGITAFKDFAQTFYKKRLQTKQASLKTCYKLLMNSVIGRCSMGPKSKHRATLIPREDNFMFMDQQYFLQVQPQQLPPVGRLVRLTAYITDCSKCYLDQLAQKAGYTNVLYCDTDSLMVTQEGFRALGSPGTKAALLGQFKCQGPSDGKDIYYTQGYFKNRKDYILKYQKQNGQQAYLYKAKGIPRKFITRQYTQQVISCFLAQMPRILRMPQQTKVIIGNKVRMQVWRKKFGSQAGIIIQEMMKSSSVIVDRWHQSQTSTGVPRAGPSTKFQIQMDEDQFL